MSNWTPEVIADHTGKWIGNGLTFGTKREAQDYVADLFGRWSSVRETRVIETDKPISHALVRDGDGTLRLIDATAVQL